MATTLAKAFEAKVKEDWQKMENAVIDRLYDPTAGFHGIANICDFIGYKYPFIAYLEVKTVKGNTFPFTNLTQYDALTTKIDTPGAIAGVIIWFYEKGQILFAPIEEIEKMKDDGLKSINCKDFIDDKYVNKYDLIKIPSIKKRTYYDSDYSVLITWAMNKYRKHWEELNGKYNILE